MNMVTVARYTNLLEAHIARGRLESEGIAAFIADENIIWANWLLADAIGGVQLRVSLEDSARARRILSEVADGNVIENASSILKADAHHRDTAPFRDSTMFSRPNPGDTYLLMNILINILLLTGIFFLLYGIAKGIEHYF
jgi:hypothetical protein